jgi:hypothetical protein
MAEGAERAAAIVQADFVRKFSPGECLDLQHVMQVFHEFVGFGTEMPDTLGLWHRIEMFAQVMHATARRHDDGLEITEEIDEMGFRTAGGTLASIIRHGLPAAGLSLWINHVDPQPFQKLQAGDADFGEEGIDEAGNGEGDGH